VTFGALERSKFTPAKANCSARPVLWQGARHKLGISGVSKCQGAVATYPVGDYSTLTALAGEDMNFDENSNAASRFRQ